MIVFGIRTDDGTVEFQYRHFDTLRLSLMDPRFFGHEAEYVRRLLSEREERSVPEPVAGRNIDGMIFVDMASERIFHIGHPSNNLAVRQLREMRHFARSERHEYGSMSLERVKGNYLKLMETGRLSKVTRTEFFYADRPVQETIQILNTSIRDLSRMIDTDYDIVHSASSRSTLWNRLDRAGSRQKIELKIDYAPWALYKFKNNATGVLRMHEAFMLANIPMSLEEMRRWDDEYINFIRTERTQFLETELQAGRHRRAVKAQERAVLNPEPPRPMPQITRPDRPIADRDELSDARPGGVVHGPMRRTAPRPSVSVRASEDSEPQVRGTLIGDVPNPPARPGQPAVAPALAEPYQNIVTTSRIATRAGNSIPVPASSPSVYYTSSSPRRVSSPVIQNSEPYQTINWTAAPVSTTSILYDEFSFDEQEAEEEAEDASEVEENIEDVGGSVTDEPENIPAAPWSRDVNGIIGEHAEPGRIARPLMVRNEHGRFEPTEVEQAEIARFQDEQLAREYRQHRIRVQTEAERLARQHERYEANLHSRHEHRASEAARAQERQDAVIREQREVRDHQVANSLADNLANSWRTAGGTEIPSVTELQRYAREMLQSPEFRTLLDQHGNDTSED